MDYKLLASSESALLFQAFLGRSEINPTICVLLHDILDISCIALKMHVVATNGLDEGRRGPHADTPAVAIVCANLVVPLHVLLASNVPEASRTPLQYGAQGTKELSTDSVCFIMVALVVAVAVALTWAHCNSTLSVRLHFRLQHDTFSRWDEAASQHEEDEHGVEHHRSGIEVYWAGLLVQ